MRDSYDSGAASSARRGGREGALDSVGEALSRVVSVRFRPSWPAQTPSRRLGVPDRSQRKTRDTMDWHAAEGEGGSRALKYPGAPANGFGNGSSPLQAEMAHKEQVDR
jgi:hypothetical protein